MGNTFHEGPTTADTWDSNLTSIRGMTHLDESSYMMAVYSHVDIQTQARQLKGPSVQSFQLSCQPDTEDMRLAR